MYKIPISAENENNLLHADALCTDMCSINVTNNETVHDEPFYCRINTKKAIYKIPHQEILFIESEQKNSIFHLSEDTICVPIPLYRIRDALPEATFVQTHRSFIVNLSKASYIDKTKEPWAISFFGSEQLAFVSRSFKKNVLQIIRPLLDFSTEE
nr:LytTR family DNA-binding domain-containing protein [uncultured Anaerotignum sp.]